jgi:hypothetical protein
MKTKAKGLSVGPMAVIAAAASSLRGENGTNGRRWRGKEQNARGLLTRIPDAVPEAVRRGGSKLRLPSLNGNGRGMGKTVQRLPKLIERAGMVIGVAAAGMKLLSDLRGGEGDQGESSGSRQRTASPRRSGSTSARGGSSKSSSTSARGGSSSSGRTTSKKSIRRSAATGGGSTRRTSGSRSSTKKSTTRSRSASPRKTSTSSAKRATSGARSGS